MILKQLNTNNDCMLQVHKTEYGGCYQNISKCVINTSRLKTSFPYKNCWRVTFPIDFPFNLFITGDAGIQSGVNCWTFNFCADN